METYTEGKIQSGIGVLVSLGIIFGLAIPKFYLAAQVLSNRTLPPETITLLHDDYISEAKLPFIIGVIVLLISLLYAYDYTYIQPAKDRKEKAEKDQKQLESDEADELKKELKRKEKLKENLPEIKEQRESEAQAAFEEHKQELERTLRHARNQAARELELEELRLKIKNAEQEARDKHARREEEYTARPAPPIDPLAAVYLTTQEIDQIARQAVTRIGILPSSQQHQAWVEWQNDITEKYDLLIRNELVVCALRLRG